MSGHKKVVEIYHQFGAKKGHHAEVKMIENSKKIFFWGKSVGLCGEIHPGQNFVIFVFDYVMRPLCLVESQTLDAA